MERCRECGDTKPLDAIGKCRWRAGCEHRQMVHEARMSQLNAALDNAERLATLPWTFDHPAALAAQWRHDVGLHVLDVLFGIPPNE